MKDYKTEIEYCQLYFEIAEKSHKRMVKKYTHVANILKSPTYKNMKHRVIKAMA